MGERVFHQKFGYVKLLESKGIRLEIAFEQQAGVKKVGSRYLSTSDDVPF